MPETKQLPSNHRAVGCNYSLQEPPDFLCRVELWLVTRQEVELYPWMLGKPFLHGSGLVNTVVVQDYVNSARGVPGSDAFEKLDELSRALSIKYVVDEAACADI